MSLKFFTLISKKKKKMVTEQNLRPFKVFKLYFQVIIVLNRFERTVKANI